MAILDSAIPERSIAGGPAGGDSPQRSSSKRLAAWSLSAAGVMLLVMALPLLSGRFYTCDDLGNLHLSLRAFYAQQLARGEPFDWMPWMQCGFHLTGEGEAGTYHPLHRFLYRFLPLQAAMGMELLLTYPWLLAGSYGFLRRLLRGRDGDSPLLCEAPSGPFRKIGNGALSSPAMVGALTVTFGSFALLRFVHPQAIAVFAHLPWLLWTLDVLLTSKGFRGRGLAATLIAVLTGSQVLLGYPQFLWLSLLTESVYAIYRSVELGLWPWRRFETSDAGVALRRSPAWAGVWIGAKSLGAMLGAIQLLPTLEEIPRAARLTATSEFFNAGSLHPLNLVQWIAPYLFTDRVVDGTTIECGCYLGAVPLVLVVLLRANLPRNVALRRLAMAAAVFGLLALLLAMGPAGQLYGLLRMVPGVGSFRYPCRYMGLVQLAVAVLTVLGFAILTGQGEERRASPIGAAKPQPIGLARDGESRRSPVSPAIRCRPLLALVIASVLVALIGPLLWREHVSHSALAIWAGPLLIGLAAGLAWLTACGSRWAPVALVVMTVADQGYYGMSVSVFPEAERLDSYLASAVAPPGNPSGRIGLDLVFGGDMSSRNGNQLTLSGWNRVDGFVGGLESRRLLDYRTLPALRIAGVRWVRRNAATLKIDGLRGSEEQWLEVPDPLSRARLLARAEVSSDPAADLALLEIEREALVDRPIELDSGEPGQVRISNDRPGAIRMVAESSGRRLLAISESYHPGWRASVDEQAVEVVRVNGDFLGCVVGSGRHEVYFEFRPWSLQAGRVFSAAGLMVLLALLVFRIVTSRWFDLSVCKTGLPLVGLAALLV